MYSRRILHYPNTPTGTPTLISPRAIAGAWFELHRQGGCGAGQLKLHDTFPARGSITIGDWIAFDYDPTTRWYLGRVEEFNATSPAGVSLRLEGMTVELNEVFPGGFASTAADNIPPHRYARTDLFPHDPDYSDETADSVDSPAELVTLLLQQYITPRTHITHNPALIEAALPAAELTSLKFRGEESARSIIKDLALRARNAAWGVDPLGRFFFLRPNTSTLATYREGTHLGLLEESRDREHLFNRILLTGGYIYDETVNSDVTARGFYRWRGNYIQPASRNTHGERRIRLWVPWIRTRSDARTFATEFFRVYSQPTARYLIEVPGASSLPFPWLGRIRLEDRTGAELITAPVETIRVEFDRTPRFRIELGPGDPRTLWPEPPHDERWEIPTSPTQGHGGDIITFPATSSTTPTSSDFSSDNSSSDISSDSSAWSSSVDASSDSSSLDSSDSSESSLNSSGSSALSSEDSSGISSSEQSSLDSSMADSSDATSSNASDSLSDFTSGTDFTDTLDSGTSLDSSSSSDVPTSDTADSSSSDSFNAADYGSLLLWLDADRMLADNDVNADGDLVDFWTDHSGNNNHAGQGVTSQRPTFRTNQINGLPAVVADGDNDRLHINTLVQLESPVTIVYIARYHSGDVLLGSNADGLGVEYTADTPVLFQPGGSSVPADTAAGAGFELRSIVYSGSTAQHFLNGSADGSDSLSATPSGGSGYQLFNQNAAAFLQIDLALILIYDEALSPTTRQQLEQVLQTKYNLP